MNSARIGNQHLLCDIGLAWHRHQFAAHEVFEAIVFNHRFHCLRYVAARRLAATAIKIARHCADEIAGHEFLHCFVPGERIVVLRSQKHEIIPRYVALDRNRG